MPFNPDLAAQIAADHGLSPQEIAMIPSAMIGLTPCVFETDVTIAGGGLSFSGTLCVYGRAQPGFYGDRETPDEPAGIEITAVTINLGGVEQDITCTLGHGAMDALAKAAEEEGD